MSRRFAATVTGVYDGDTITVDLDLGFGVQMQAQKIRLLGLDAPEVRGSEREEGLVCRDFLRERILDQEVTLVTDCTKCKYGRWLARVEHKGEDMCSMLINKGLATELQL